jgi:hypothetical protein
MGMMAKSFVKTGQKITFTQSFSQVLTAGSSSSLSTAGKILYGIGKFSWQMLDEMVMEQITSEGLQLLGVNAQIADMLGESFSFGNVIETITESVQSASGSKGMVKQSGEVYSLTTTSSATVQTQHAASPVAANLQFLTALQTGIQSAASINTKALTNQQQLHTLFNHQTQTGGGMNLQQLMAIGEQMDLMGAFDYPNGNDPQVRSKIENILRDKLGDVVVDCLLTADVDEQIQILWNYLEGDGIVDELELGDNYQSLHLQVTIKGISKSITIDTRTADNSQFGSVWIRIDGRVELLSNFMKTQGIKSIPQLLAMSTNYEMVDPINSKYPKTVTFADGHTITFDINQIVSFEDYDFAIKKVMVNGQLIPVLFKLKLQGCHGWDVNRAKEKLKELCKGEEISTKGYAWHHVDDVDPETGEYTMQLVRLDVHQGFSHYGAKKWFKDAYDLDYDGKSEVLDTIYQYWGYYSKYKK